MDFEQAGQTIDALLAKVKRTGKKLEGAERAAMFRAYDVVNNHHAPPLSGIMALLRYGPLCLNGGAPTSSNEQRTVCWNCGLIHD